MTYPVESNVPPPPGRAANGVESKERATIRLLKPGESFLADLGDDQERRTRQGASDESKGGKRYTCAKQKDGRVRCWRIE